MAPSADSSKLSEEIDELLEHYLELLDQYTKLRAQLSTVQSSVHQHISRANFSAERGVRYGPDFYDTRMQATRVCRITVPSLDTTTTVAGGTQQHDAVEGQTLDDVERNTAGHTSAPALKDKDAACFTISTGAQKEEDGAQDGADESGKTKLPRDPLRMFGLLTPQALRLAQMQSAKAVEGIVPKLVSVDVEMKEVEIQIRRARKWKAKAEAQEEKSVGVVDEKRAERPVEK